VVNDDIAAYAMGYQAGLADGFDLGLAEARRKPVCDWCEQPVVLVEGRKWCHADGFYGCSPERLWGRYAQVSGSEGVYATKEEDARQ